MLRVENGSQLFENLFLVDSFHKESCDESEFGVCIDRFGFGC